MSAVVAGLSASDLDLARTLWAKGVPSEKISAKLCISDSTFASLRHRDRSSFPARARGNTKAVAASDAPREPKSDLNRYRRAFLPLPKCTPEPFATSQGCSWPVYGEAMNPLESPTATHVCGQPRLIRGDKVESYCSVHYHVAHQRKAV